MTLSLIPADDRVRRFVCTGGETVFNITFPVFAATDVQVLRVRALVTTTLAQPADYTVAGAGGPSGFTVTLTAPALAGDVVVVVSAQPASRTAQWTDGQALRAQALNAEFARWWIALQQLQRDGLRAIRTPITDPLTSIEMPPAADRANRFLAFNAAGEPIALGSPDAPLGAVARTGDTMLGDLTLAGPPTVPLHAATKAYVDTGDAALNTAIGARVAKAGDTMTGFLTLHADPTAPMHAVTKQYVDRGYSGIQTLTNVTGVDFTGIPSWANNVIVYVSLLTTTSHSLRVLLGDVNGFVTSNYISRASNFATGVSSAQNTACFLTAAQEISATFVSLYEIKRQRNLNRWLFTSVGSYDNPGTMIGIGYLNTDLVLDRVRVYVAGGTMTGQCHVEWRR